MDTKVTDKGIRYYVGSIEPARGVVFVFGSNPEGRHGLGAARVAKDRFGARYGVGEGLVGNSYALPTKDLRVTANRGLRSIAPEVITESVKRMYETARQNPDRLFCVAYRNTDDASLNGYTALEMMDMFNAAGPVPGNVVFSQEWALSGHLDESLFMEAAPVVDESVKSVSVAVVGGRDNEDNDISLGMLHKEPFADRRLNVLDDIAFEITYGGDRFDLDDIWFIMGEVTRDEIVGFRQRVFDRAMELYPDQGKDFVQKGVDYWLPMEFAVSHKRNEGWARLSPNGYECSTRGDMCFSAMVASFKPWTFIFGQDVGGMTIEDVYQKLIKRSGKGQPPAPDSPLYRMDLPKNEREDFMYREGYLPLWTMWAEQNGPLIRELRQKADGLVLTDRFAATRVSQARALDDILCGRLHYFSEGIEKQFEKIYFNTGRTRTPDGGMVFPRGVELAVLEGSEWVRHGVAWMSVRDIYSNLIMKSKEGEGPSPASPLWFHDSKLSEDSAEVLATYYFEMAYKPLVYYWALLTDGPGVRDILNIGDSLTADGRSVSMALEAFGDGVALDPSRVVHIAGPKINEGQGASLCFDDRPPELQPSRLMRI